jgi:hypothetical protein
MGLITIEERIALKKAIDTLHLIVGAAPFGSDEAPIDYLAGFITRRYPNIRAEQLLEAFEMAAAKQLFLGNKLVEVNTYGQPVHGDLVGSVLTAYNERARQIAAAPKRNEPAPDGGDHFKPTPQWHYEFLLKQINEDGELPAVQLWETIYAHMVVLGIVKAWKKPTDIRMGRKLKIDSIGDMMRADPYRLMIEKHFVEKKLIKPRTDD